MKNKALFLNNFYLKLIAILSMTLDHVALFLVSFNFISDTSVIYTILRILGRIALPIFIYLLYEGVKHSTNIKKYLFRLGSLSLLIYLSIVIILLVIENNKSLSVPYFQNIFLTLFMLVLGYYLIFINKKKKYYFFLIPIIGLFVISYIYEILCSLNYVNSIYKIVFDGLTLMYPLESLLMFSSFILINFIYEKKVFKLIGKENGEAYLVTSKGQMNRNIFMCISIVITSLLCYLLTYIEGLPIVSFYVFETYLVISIPFIIFYNGELGRQNKITKRIFYLYYPIHFILIAIICLIINGGI